MTLKSFTNIDQIMIDVAIVDNHLKAIESLFKGVCGKCSNQSPK